ncbi:MAG: hypothetical protein Q9220_005162 [cf. Caloplaca sp. 1 TL-2023]
MEPGKPSNFGDGNADPDIELRRQKSSGSVKRARERAAAGLPPEGRDPLEPAPLRITPNRTPPRATTPNHQVEIDPPPQAPSFIPQQNTTPSSSTTPTPTTPSQPSRSVPSSPLQDARTARGPPPKRPPRPDYVPPLTNQPSDQQSPNYWEGNFMTPTGSGRTPENAGKPGIPAADVPEYPTPFTPQPLPQPRRNLGPPPSARKGGANFYPQNTFVAPIPEEQSETHSSFASSHVIPASWGDGPPEYYMGSGIDEEEDDDIHSPSSTNDGRDPRTGVQDESTGLVRKVSIGKPGKPALKNVKEHEDQHSRAGQEVQFGPGAGVATFLAPSSDNNSPAGTPRGERAVADEMDVTRSHSGTASSPTSPVDPRVAKILGGLEKGGALSTAATTPMTSTAPSMSEKGGRRPARLKLDAVKESEPRGSATSLPELIRRATRLASNLDRGKTASRIGMLEMLEKEKSKHPSRSGSISDILAAFPSPSLATPERQSPRFPPSTLSRSALRNDFTTTPSHSEYGKSQYRGGRRCCGLPIWAFILLCIILLLLIAAAVIIPITLIVLPRQNNNGNSNSVAGCRKSFPCANGGTSVLESNSCRCICMNGFTGASCNAVPDSGCTTRDIETYKNATLGTSIGRLLTAADANYSIPLHPSTLLSLFSTQNLTCTNENALVTFNGKPQKKKKARRQRRTLNELFLLLHPRHQAATLSSSPTRPLLLLANRASPPQASVTSNGIVYAAPSSPEQTSSPSSSSSTSSSTNTTTTTTTNTTTPTVASTSSTLSLTPSILDFARTAILFIFQERDLATAVTAQENMQAVFSPAAAEGSGSGTFNASVRDVGSGILVDWGKLSLDLGNGTSFGGKGGEEGIT